MPLSLASAMAQPLLAGEEERGHQMQAANVQLLAQLCQPGDFLSAKIRTSLVRETLQATISCQACRQLQAHRPQEEDVWDAILADPHSFHEPEACYGLGVVVHALANTQNLLKEGWYHKAVDHVWATLQKLGEVPPEARDTAQERLYRMTELIACVALAVGHRTFYRSLGKERRCNSHFSHTDSATTTPLAGSMLP